MPLSGQKGLVTGGGHGIGRAVVLAMARAGADLVVTDVDEAAAAAVAAEARTLRPRAHVLSRRVDVRDADSVADAVDETVTELGVLDVAANIAGVSSMERVVNLSEEEWDQNLDVNAKGVFLCCRAEVRAMLEADGHGGSIVNMASAAGKQGAPFLAHYCASKFAVVGFTQSLALEVAEAGIRVNAVCPGYVATPMQEREVLWEGRLRGLQPEDVRSEYRRMVPLGRLATPEDVADVVLFLLSDQARYLTGEAVNVTGGILV